MRRFPLLAAMSVLLLCACAKESGPVPAAGPAAPAAASDQSLSVFLPGQVNVYFDDELLSLVEAEPGRQAAAPASAGLQTAFEELGVVSMERLFPYDEEFEERHREFGLHRWYKVRFEGGTPAPAAVERFKLVPGVSTARPVYKAKIAATETFFNDPMENRQWHYHNGSVSWADVNVLPVWKNYTRGNSNVIVSVVDGGIDLQHEDLADAVVPPGDNGSRSFMESGSAYRITGHSHGTHVGGTIGAINNNGKGVVGLAGGDAQKGEKGVRLMSCQVFAEGGGGASFENALIWGADHGAVISNNSWGYDFAATGTYNKEAAEASHKFFLQPNSGAYRDPLKDAVDYFSKYGGMSKSGQQTGPMAGGLVIFAAGNEGRPYGAPACYPGCLAVGAITSYGGRSNFSNYGEWVDICAPGVDIVSTIPGNAYAEFSGTSMACPHVSGVAALVVSYCGGSGFTAQQLRDKLVGGANSADVPSSFRIGPLVDALGAITYGTGEPPAPVEEYSVTGVLSNNVSLSIRVPSDRDGQPAYGFRVFASENLSDLQGCDPRSPGASVIYGDIVNRETPVGGDVEGEIGDLGFNKTYYIAVSAFDYGRNFSELSSVKTVETGSNHKPVITTSYDGDFRFHVHDSFTIPFAISDEDHHVLNVTFERDAADNGVLTLLESTKSGEYVLQVLGFASPAGKYRAVLQAADNYGASAEYVIDYVVLPNQKPVVLKEMDNILINNPGDAVKINMEDYISDPDGEVLSYNINISDRSVVQVTQSGSQLNIIAIADAGLATVSLSAVDAGGEKVQASFKVLVRSAGQQMQAYPNPVVDILYVGSGEEKESTDIAVYNVNGVKVFERNFLCSAFDPAQIDMTKAGAGTYTIEVSYGGNVYKGIIIKK